MDEGYIAVYRQFQGLNVTAGYIGASQSEERTVYVKDLRTFAIEK